MSENTEAVVESAEADETPAEPTPDADTTSGDDTKSQNAEAAKYRRRLRDAQLELETVTKQLDALQRQQVESMLADSGMKTDAIWAVSELSELLDDDGAIDAEKLAGAVEIAREKFGIPKKTVGNYVPGVGSQPSARPRANAWREAFAPKR